MLKVLLVDDEPFIIQGLKVIIDWENEEFEIAGTTKWKGSPAVSGK